MKVPFLAFNHMHSPIREEVMSVFASFYDSNWYILGERVKAFEQEYAAYNNVKYCVGLSNGLDALTLSLKTLGIGPCDEVIVPSNTYIATVLAVSYLGASPVLVEPNKNTYNISVENIENAITNRTKVIMPVHLYGQICEMETIMQTANKYNLYVVEDNAQAHGSSYNGKFAGSFGHINATSFYPGKNLGALGDAGAITTNYKIYADKVMVFRNYGSQKKYYNEVIGHNMRLDELQAAVLSVKLRYMQEWTNERQELAKKYDQLLHGVGDLILPVTANLATHVYHLYVIRTAKRNELQAHLNERGVGTLIHYPIPPHLQEAYKSLNYKKGAFPIAEEIADTIISIPLFIGMNESEQEYVVASIKNFFN